MAAIHTCHPSDPTPSPPGLRSRLALSVSSLHLTNSSLEHAQARSHAQVHTRTQPHTTKLPTVCNRAQSPEQRPANLGQLIHISKPPCQPVPCTSWACLCHGCPTLSSPLSPVHCPQLRKGPQQSPKTLPHSEKAHACTHTHIHTQLCPSSHTARPQQHPPSHPLFPLCTAQSTQLPGMVTCCHSPSYSLLMPCTPGSVLRPQDMPKRNDPAVLVTEAASLDYVYFGSVGWVQSSLVLSFPKPTGTELSVARVCMTMQAWACVCVCAHACLLHLFWLHGPKLPSELWPLHGMVSGIHLVSRECLLVVGPRTWKPWPPHLALAGAPPHLPSEVTSAPSGKLSWIPHPSQGKPPTPGFPGLRPQPLFHPHQNLKVCAAKHPSCVDEPQLPAASSPSRNLSSNPHPLSGAPTRPRAPTPGTAEPKTVGSLGQVAHRDYPFPGCLP